LLFKIFIIFFLTRQLTRVLDIYYIGVLSYYNIW